MKKIIAISVMFALIAGAVFADTSIGGAVETRFSLASQMGDDGDDPTMGGYVAAAQFTFSGSNADGTLGGQWRYRNTNEGKNKTIEAFFDQAFVWWKPIEQVKIFLGIEQDGLFDTCDFVGWGFHAGDNDYLFNHNWDFWRQIFPGNWDGFGLAFSFYPMPGLDINLALATGKVSWRQAPRSSVENIVLISDPDSDSKNMGMLPGRLRFVANYSLDFGKISLVYIGGGSAKEKGAAYMVPGSIDGDNNGLFGLSALITAIEGIQIKVGGSIVLNTDSDNLINAGLGVAWAGDGFGVKFRAGLVTQGDAGMFITGNIMPYFAVGEKGQVLVDIGVTNDGTKDDKGMGWYVTPAYRLNMEGGAFKIGIQLFNNIKVNDTRSAASDNVGTYGGGNGTGYSNIGSAGNVGISGADFLRWNIPMLLSFNF